MENLRSLENTIFNIETTYKVLQIFSEHFADELLTEQKKNCAINEIFIKRAEDLNSMLIVGQEKLSTSLEELKVLFETMFDDYQGVTKQS